jgi:dGTPase
LREFLFRNVYFRAERLSEKEKIREILLAIHAHVSREPLRYVNPYPEADPVAVRILDFIAGMTDNYALDLFRKISLPEYSL